MHWILAIIGALLGAGLSESRELFGAIAGFLIVFVWAQHAQLARKVAELERHLLVLRARALVPSAPPATAPAPVTPAPLPVAPTSAVASEPAPVEIVTPAPEPPPIPSAPIAPPMPCAPAAPGWEEKLVARIKSWFTEGNVPVKIGVVISFIGVASALKFASDRGLFSFPIEFRMAGMALLAIAALGFGWRERESRPAFGLSLQGGALGVLLLVVFASFRLYGLILPMPAFALIVLLVAGAALLSVLQDNLWLAVLGFLGGYLAPVLISTGSNNPVGLFSYYAVLNAAVFCVSWKRSWRLLNLVGFGFTFGVGTAWGLKFYQPELFNTVEPFLILFFVFYIVIGLLYVVRQSEHRRPWVDGTLVFGTPLLAFPLQAGLLKDDRMALAFSALAVALLYAVLVWWLRRRRGERLLTEAYGALALGFATLAVPLAFSAGTTASVWALEGAGVAWLGIRQNRTFPWLSGLALQLMAAVAYTLWLWDASNDPSSLLLLNPEWLGAAILAFSGFALSLVHDRYRPRFKLPMLLFAWAMFWWFVGGITQIDHAERSLGAWQFASLYLSASLLAASLLRKTLAWPRSNQWTAVIALLGLLMVFYAKSEFGTPLAEPTWLPWALYGFAAGVALWNGREEASRSLSLAHLTLLWSMALATTWQLGEFTASTLQLGNGWNYVALVAPAALMTLALWQRPQWLAWPRAGMFEHYAIGWFAPAVTFLILTLALGLFMEGLATPLAFLPLLNPLEMAWLAALALVFAIARERSDFSTWRRLWPGLGLAFASMATLRAVHHWHGEPWSMAVLDSGVSQSSLTVVWSLLGVGSMWLASRRQRRPLWIGGFALMIAVCAKLMIVDRHYIGNQSGIVSFLVVGMLLVGVGYLSPSPPKTPETEGTP
jgi:uncharacterized membrane protein